jgi:mRNA-degrading endonuclease YafQ of YafQ-DinJ toxin-antitoxin module
MYEIRLTTAFIRATKKEDLEALKQALEEIAANPYTARDSHLLRHEWAGFRAADFVRGKRIIYRICEECVSKHQEEMKPLPCCTQTDAHKILVTFVDFGDYHTSAGRRRLRPASVYEVHTETEAKESASEDQA